RIQQAHPRFDRASYRKGRASATKEFDAPEKKDDSEKRKAAAVGIMTAAAVAPAGRRGADMGAEWGRSAGESAKIVGAIDGSKVDYAARLLGALPSELRERLRNPDGARAALVALLLAPKEEVMKSQLDAMKAAGLGP